MAKLFKNKIIKQKLETFRVDDFEKKLEIVQKWQKDYHTGTLKTDKEISRAPGWTQDFLGEILGYIRKPSELHTYDTEYTVAGQRPDFVLGHFSNAKGYVIGELKDAKTSLDAPQKREGSLTPVQQAFKYKGNLRDSSFVIVSNFFETRLYYDNYLDYEMWTLDTLINPKDDYFELRKFLYLLSEQNLIAKRGESTTKGLISFIQNQQKEITKGFYKEYSLLRKELFKDIIVQAKKSGKVYKQSELDLILSKTQKIIDRIIFIHFCEDLDLLPQGKLKENLTRAEEIGFSPWEMLKKFFEFVNSGSDRLGIPDGYNGGLFHKDEELEALEVGDEICKKFVDLGEYDFEDDLSVNILGHIFEQSISDIEELKDKIQKNEEVALSKRKKDGVFYTPEYIVDYIVKNSVGKKIEDWEQELKQKHNLKEDINDKNYTKRAILVYSELQERLQNITVLDPACGSGAFLVKVFDFLLAKNEEITKTLEDLGINQGLFSSSVHFKSILQNNIYGVDLNEESVEITKLSLWLKTAIKGRKLANLDSNIKCGNSLIDNPAIAGDKAFSWETEFPQIFKDGGFDVIVGNPPYGAKLDASSKDFLREKYNELQFKIDTYSAFLLLSSYLLNNTGKCYFIIPSTLQDNFFESKIREKLLTKSSIEQIIELDDKVFEAAVVHSMIFGFAKNKTDNYFIKVGIEKKIIDELEEIPMSFFSEQVNFSFNLRNYKIKDLLSKLGDKSINLKSVLDLRQAIKTGNDKKYVISEKQGENFKPILGGKDIYKWGCHDSNQYVNYGKHLACPRDYKIFEQPKILIREAGNSIISTLDENNNYIMSSLYNGISLNKNYTLRYILCLINSSLFQFLMAISTFDKTAGAFTKAKIFHYYELPIKEISVSKQTPFIEKADFMLENNKVMGEKIQKFLKRVQGIFELEKLSKKLQVFYELDFADFVKELKKVKVILSLKDQDEWEEYFESYKSEIEELKTKIDACDREIDEMVFDLYGLSEEEREVVINS